MKTFSIKPSEIKKDWYVIDATDLVLGRLSAFVATRLRGKHKPEFTPHMDCGDNIIIVNAEKVALTGNKASDKIFYWHTGHPGGIKQRTMQQRLSSDKPQEVIKKSVERMLSKGPLSRKLMKNLHVYAGPEHKHEAQQPQAIDFSAMNRKNKRSS